MARTQEHIEKIRASNIATAKFKKEAVERVRKLQAQLWALDEYNKEITSRYVEARAEIRRLEQQLANRGKVPV